MFRENSSPSENNSELLLVSFVNVAREDPSFVEIIRKRSVSKVSSDRPTTSDVQLHTFTVSAWLTINHTYATRAPLSRPLRGIITKVVLFETFFHNS